jgi:SEC-C motif
MSKRRRGYNSETRVKRGQRIVHRDKELIEKLGRNDPCPCLSGRRFQSMLSDTERLLLTGSTTNARRSFHCGIGCGQQDGIGVMPRTCWRWSLVAVEISSKPMHRTSAELLLAA